MERETASSFITVNLIETSGAARKGAESVPRSNRECTKRSSAALVFLSVSSLPLLFFLISQLFFQHFSPLSSSFFSIFPLFSFLPPPLPPPLCPSRSSSFHFDDDLARSPIMTNDVEDIISRNEPVFVLIAPCYLSLEKGRKSVKRRYKETSGSDP